MAASSVTGRGSGSAELPIRGLGDLKKVLSQNKKKAFVDTAFLTNDKLSSIIELNPSNGDALVWDESQNKWISNGNVLTNANINSPENGQTLVYNLSTGHFENQNASNIASILKTKTITTTESPYTLGSSSEAVLLCNAINGIISINLPTASDYSDQFFHIKKIDATSNKITISGANSETIDGSGSIEITAQNYSIKIISDSENWYIL